MSTHTLDQNAPIDLDTPESDPAAKTRRWWNPFTRSDRPRRQWLGKRRRLMEDLRAEHNRLVETLEKLNERLDASESSSSPSMEIDPMPVIRGIEDISKGQKEISMGLSSLNEHMERSEKVSDRLTNSIDHVDQTLEGVRKSQTDTAGAVARVGERMEDVTARFESLFDRMAESEKEMARDYQKLQQRTLVAVAGIAATVVLVLALFMTAPWA
ncbi:hypothetical protein HAHE_37720 [Haloferula helveola]|uniref:t-SNARE coiled-coil homology domain-containing protein n=1 Tax=Haloferula helveola TaxID=490095 RepID=A0ABM7RP98_9BACT|nr:hypothetical protein HAHE_37720 [Haloferula helveola]